MGIDAKASAQGKEVEAATKISAAMFCENHNRLCYLTINGTCAVYGPTMLKGTLDYARKYISRLVFNTGAQTF